MAGYVYGEQQIERMITKSRRLRIQFCVAALAVLTLSCVLALNRPDLPIFREPMRAWVIALLTSLFLGPLLGNIWRWRSWPERMRNSLRETRVEVTSSTTGVSAVGYRRQLSNGEIVRAEEPFLSAGLHQRSANRYRWILIPRNLDGYEAIKRELAAAGIAVVKTSIPPNWEEFLGVLVFIGTIFCAISVHSIRVLTVNLFASLLLSLGGLFVINSLTDAIPRSRMRLMKLGAFLSVAFAVLGLWLAHP
jgi:hypothetical protein